MFKIIGNKNNLGDKANGISKLFQFNFNIPNTIIIENKSNFLKNEITLFKSKKYILRPSFDGEDSLEKSYAGFFKSFYPLSKEEIIKKLKSKNLSKLFGLSVKTFTRKG